MHARSPDRTRRARRALALAVASAVVVAGLATVAITLRHHATIIPGCTIASGATSYSIDIDQAVNAATIAAVGRKRGLPDHAATVAIAAALQESQLHNLGYGDRDSLGLFQQRPSQGWGTAQQLTTPTYAANAFFDALARVPGWVDLPVTVAAQRVQRSATPDAYANWEPEARTLAAALTGEVPAGIACRFRLARSKQPPPAYAAGLTRELGISRVDAQVPAPQAWTAAAWLTAHAQSLRIVAISLRGRRWTAASGRWRSSPPADGELVVQQAAIAT